MRDIDIRRALRIEMARRHDGGSDTLCIEELGLCQGVARVDFAVVNGSIHGYEIKSDRDTLARLPNQSDIYNRALEFVTIIATENHLDKIEDAIPSWWGIWRVVKINGEIRLEESRKHYRNPAINPFALAQFLWRDEALQVLSAHDRAMGMRSRSRQELWARIASDFTLDELGHIVRNCLKHRRADWRAPALQV